MLELGLFFAADEWDGQDKAVRCSSELGFWLTGRTRRLVYPWLVHLLELKFSSRKAAHVVGFYSHLRKTYSIHS